MKIIDIKTGVFLAFLAAAAWQDLRRQSISVWLYIVFGAGGILLEKGFHPEMAGSAGVGILLLALGKLCRGAVGDGDGLFFVVSGLYLSAVDNIMLFMWGLMLCSIYSLFLIARCFLVHTGVRGKTVPFLPFLLPVWIWMVFL